MCIYAFKEILNVYKKHSSPLFVCFLDASKAFDKINYWLLFDKLLKCNLPYFVVRLLYFWYSSQHVSVQWGSALSSPFLVANGVKQGGLLSPILFNFYMNVLSIRLTGSGVGCTANGSIINYFIYADDMCIVAPCANALQKLLDICTHFASTHDIVYNTTKSVCMHVKSDKYKLCNLPSVTLSNNTLLYVNKYKYLGCIITDTLHDNDDIKRTIRGIYARGNMLMRRFYNCSESVKCMLFRTYCTNFYCTQLWWSYSRQTIRKIQVAFNNSFRLLMGFRRRCSASGMFVDCGVNNFTTLRRKYMYNFISRLSSSPNQLITTLYRYCSVLNVPSVHEFFNTLYSSRSSQFLS